MLPMRKFGNKNVVDWKDITKGFEFMINETRCEVVSNKMIEKVSKNGKARRERRLTVRAICSEATIEVSSTSFKAMSFTKRLNKAMKEVKQATYGLIIHPLWARVYEAHALHTNESIDINEFSEEDLEKSKKDYYRAINKTRDLLIKNYLDKTEDDEETIKRVINEMEKEGERRLNDVEAQLVYYYVNTEFSKCNTLQDAKKLYRELCNREHPDKGGDEMRFKAIKKAYEQTKEDIEEFDRKMKKINAELFEEFDWFIV